MRLINADKLSESIHENVIAMYEESVAAKEDCLREIEEAPTVDAVPVVYCKDCKYADAERRNATEKRYADSILFCRNSNLCNDEPLAMWPVDFCSYGVARKVVDDES
mgnify:CR=1 FL=1